MRSPALVAKINLPVLAFILLPTLFRNLILYLLSWNILPWPSQPYFFFSSPPLRAFYPVLLYKGRCSQSSIRVTVVVHLCFIHFPWMITICCCGCSYYLHADYFQICISNLSPSPELQLPIAYTCIQLPIVINSKSILPHCPISACFALVSHFHWYPHLFHCSSWTV